MRRNITAAQKKYGPKYGVPVGKGIVGAYPEVLSEQETMMRVADGCSIARFGDGELRIARGGTSITQRTVSNRLRDEVSGILSTRRDPKFLVGVPNICSATPKQDYWLKYAVEEYTRLMKAPPYGSTWITRSDEAPWINTPEYWEMVRSLWRSRDVTLVIGTRRSLRPEDLLGDGANSVKTVWGPRAEAYEEIDRLEAETRDGPASATQPVLLCLGVTATVLAARLARRGIWAVDLGHVGMFMRRSHILPLQRKELISEKYALELREMHAREPWGCSGWKYVADVVEFYRETGSRSFLDYGSGSETLAADMLKVAPDIDVHMYDPGVPERSMLPDPADLVVCTDVMEHIEPDRVDAVTDHILSLARTGVFFSIALGGAKQVLPGGRNAHLFVRDKEWWLKHFARWDKLWQITKIKDRGTKQVALWLEPTQTVASRTGGSSSTPMPGLISTPSED